MLRNWIVSVVAVVVAPLLVLAQEAPKYDVLKKMYDDAVGSLKAAQDAKNQLATKNEELAKQVAELQKQLDAANKERDELQRQAASFAERTFTLRTQYAAWQEFIKRYPSLAARWKAFMETDLIKPDPQAPLLIEPGWPFRIEG
jgi:peptidoglycan hydrolase CwlO-like protein